LTGNQKNKEYGTALKKALNVLELITAQSQAVGLPDISGKLGLPRQTVHRILLQLESHGLIIRDPTRDRFYVGPRMSRLAIDSLFSENQNMPTRVILRGLVDDIQESCNIGVLDGMDFVYLDRIQSDWPLRVHLEAGNHVPAHCTSGGKILLAHLPDDIRGKLIGLKPLKKHTKSSIVDPLLLEKELADCLKKTFATNNEENTVGIVGVAVPIVDNTGRAIAALACHAPVARLSLEKLKKFVPKIKKAASALGHYWS